MRGPTGRARDDEQRREHRRRHAHHVIGACAEPVEIGEHFFLAPHHRFNTIGDVEKFHVARILRQPPRDFFDHHIARVGHGVHRMAEAGHDLFFQHAPGDVRLSVSGILITRLNVERGFIRAAVFRPTQRADGTGYRGIHVRAGTRDHARRKGGRIEFVFGIQHQRGMHCTHPIVGWFSAVKQMQKVPANRIVIGLDIDAFAVDCEVIPIKQHRAE